MNAAARGEVEAVEQAEAVDGRRARRDRNKESVVDAYLDLLHEGVLHPSVAEVAERSGVSHRSVFRYFADRDEMARSSIQRQHERHAAVLNRVVSAEGTLAERVDAIIRHRLDAHDAVAPVARLSRSLSLRQPILQAELAQNRSRMRAQLRRVFARELSAIGPDRAADALAVAEVLTSFESIDLLRHDQSLSRPRALRALSAALVALLAAP